MKSYPYEKIEEVFELWKYLCINTDYPHYYILSKIVYTLKLPMNEVQDIVLNHRAYLEELNNTTENESSLKLKEV